MRDTMTVNKDSIRPSPNFLERLEQGRRFAKGEEAGHIGKRGVIPEHDRLHHFHGWKGKDHDTRNNRV